jgi:HPt (histidine-containing phosphotransfer) domain-containing protein
MTIEINDSRTVREIQREFTSRYPNLKIEFFHARHGREEVSAGNPCLPDQTIGSIRDRHTEGAISIESKRETGSIEQEFEDKFGLHVQLYRKQAEEWIQTIGTDTLSLAEQNSISRNLSFGSKHDLPGTES